MEIGELVMVSCDYILPNPSYGKVAKKLEDDHPLVIIEFLNGGTAIVGDTSTAFVSGARVVVNMNHIRPAESSVNDETTS